MKLASPFKFFSKSFFGGFAIVESIQRMHPVRAVLWFSFVVFAFTYFLFQKKLLSKPLSKLVSRLMFVPTFPITVLLRLGNYWTVVDDTVILGCAPVGFLGHPKQLYQLGVRNVVNMCSEYSGPTSYYAELGIKQLHLPSVDHYEPSVEQMKEAVLFIGECRKKQEKVYVHCKAGHGRAASIALCWLMSQNPELPAKQTNELLRSKRKVRGTLYKQPNVAAFYEHAVEASKKSRSNTNNNDISNNNNTTTNSNVINVDSGKSKELSKNSSDNQKEHSQ